MLEYCSRGDLMEWDPSIRRFQCKIKHPAFKVVKKDHSFTEGCAKNLLHQLLDAVEYCKKKKTSSCFCCFSASLSSSFFFFFSRSPTETCFPFTSKIKTTLIKQSFCHLKNPLRLFLSSKVCTVYFYFAFVFFLLSPR